MTFNLITPVRIESGSFVIGVIDDFAVSDFDENENATFPALMDVPGKSTPQGTESFFTLDGGTTWGLLSEGLSPGPPPCNGAGSFLIRGTVEIGSADVLSATRIEDPDAVEPWAVAVFGGEAIVANYVSDNLTVIKTSDNSFTNVPVGDGPGGTPDGPAGVSMLNIASANAVRAYVSLFGSNTIPSKEFPIDYSTVGPGRIQVLARTIAGTFVPVSQISVGKGPRFPAIGVGGKLYVPCAGSNRVDVIDTAANVKIKEIIVGLEPTSCAAGLGGSKVYVTNFGDDTLSVIDSRTDQVIKTIRLPQVSGEPPLPPDLTHPWNAEVSRSNGNLYVTYWGERGGISPNGGIAEFETCNDQFLRLIVDDTTRGTPSGSDGASGIEAPAAPLERDSETGLTPEAGGGGGGDFGIAGCASRTMLFTNDGLGIIGVFDSLIDQVVSSPPLSITSCPKPRDAACTRVGDKHLAYVACGQPDSSVLVVSIPQLPENISNLPTISSPALFLDSSLLISGTGFLEGTRVELIVNGQCAGFRKGAKIKKLGTRIIQNGKLTDGRSLSEVLGSTSAIRLITRDGEVRLVSCCAIP
jgi:YVTN family beta-propeller protein